MKLFIRDNRAMCPYCSGMITAKQNYYFCVDCGSVFIGIENGSVEGEVMIEPAMMAKRKMVNYKNDWR